MENLNQFNLSNSIKCIHQQVDTAEVSHFGITINAGSRDEQEGEQGLAHFIEHCIFKGTAKRKPFHILSRLDAVGGEINAYTTKEETCIYGSFLNIYYERAIELIADILFNSSFPTHEIQKEKDVIIDEINSYMDSPSEQIFDDFEDQVFKGHPIGRNILGTVDSVNSFEKKDIQAFIERNYTADNISISSVGKIKLDKFIRLCDKYFGVEFEKNTAKKRHPFIGYNTVQSEIKRDTHQVHTMIGNLAYDMHNEKRRGLILLNNVLGGQGLNNRLNLNIREKYGLTYSIESNFIPYTDTGIFQVYFSAEKKFHSKIVKLIHKEFAKLRDKELGTNQLHLAKQQLKGHIALAQENRVGLMLALGKSILLFDKVDTNVEIFEKIDAITSTEVQSIANEILVEDKFSSLTFI
ncbi:MAG: putative Zn-dependent peptidase [Flavobacteriales bacterium]